MSKLKILCGCGWWWWWTRDPAKIQKWLRIFPRDLIHQLALRLSYLRNPLAMQPAFSFYSKWKEIQMKLVSTGQRDTDVCSFLRTSLAVTSGGPRRANAEGLPINCPGIYFLGNPIKIPGIYWSMFEGPCRKGLQKQTKIKFKNKCNTFKNKWKKGRLSRQYCGVFRKMWPATRLLTPGDNHLLI